jgi:chloramphenicol-sensitive protein RarD
MSTAYTARLGYVFGAGAYLCWGLFPLYWKLLRPSSPVELLAHRILWSSLAVAAIVTAVWRWGRVGRLVVQPRRLGAISLVSALIAVNWGTYIYGVNTDRVVETSLGYFITPLVSVLLGVLVLGERLRPGQWVAVGIGTAAVGVLTIDYGRAPHIALVLAATFGLYGLLKKRLGLPAVDGLLVESAVLAVPALVVIGVLTARGDSTFGEVSSGHTALVMLTGVITVVPLLLFAGAANRIPLSAIGLLQYLAPVLQLGCGVVIYGEPMPPPRLVGFGLVWLALAVFTWDGLRRVRDRSVAGRQRPDREPVTSAAR